MDTPLVIPLVALVAAVAVLWYREGRKHVVDVGIECPRCGSADVDEASTATFRCRRCDYSPDDVATEEQAAALRGIQQIAIAVQGCGSASHAFSASYRVTHTRKGDRSEAHRDGIAYLDGIEYVTEVQRIAQELGFPEVYRALEAVPTIEGEPGPAHKEEAMAAVASAAALLEAKLAEARASSI